MADRDNDIEFTVRVKDGGEIGEVSKSLGGVETGLKGVGKESGTAGALLGGVQAKMVALAAAAAAAVTGFLGIRLFAGAVQSAGEFEAALSRVKAATDATAEEMAALKQAAEDAGASTRIADLRALPLF